MPNNYLASDAEVARRLALCDACPKLKGEGVRRRCTLCGCAMVFKTKLAGAKCPAGKW